MISFLTKLFACVGGSGKEAEDEGEKTEDTEEEEEEEGNEDGEGEEEEEGGDAAESQEEGEAKDGEVMILILLALANFGWCGKCTCVVLSIYSLRSRPWQK